jgi:hypothetical protein
MSRRVPLRPNDAIRRTFRTEARASASRNCPAKQVTCPAAQLIDGEKHPVVVVNPCTLSVFFVVKMELVSRGWTTRPIWSGSKNRAYPPHLSRPKRSRFMGSISSSSERAANYPPCSCLNSSKTGRKSTCKRERTVLTRPLFDRFERIHLRV